MTRKEGIAKIIRAVTVPPVMVCALLLILYCEKGQTIAGTLDIILSALLLGIVPLLAYPLSMWIPSLKGKGREGQRNLAFMLTFAGYLAALVYGLAAQVPQDLQLIHLTYFISVSILWVFNKLIRLRSSGHACSITGPLILIVYFIGWKIVLPCVVLFALIVWASLTLQRHTAKELIWGALTAAFAFAVSLMLTGKLG